LPDENEHQIEKFLAAHPEFALTPCGLDGAPYLAMSPAQHSTDGFFAAVMTKEKAAETPVAPTPPIES
jgi:16S rRNA (cytosine967-C5)-methyltransferase